jgi:hypothetical protein
MQQPLKQMVHAPSLKLAMIATAIASLIWTTMAFVI